MQHLFGRNKGNKSSKETKAQPAQKPNKELFTCLDTKDKTMKNIEKRCTTQL